MIICLLLILGLILILPFLHKKIEEELEIFLFVMGVLSITVTAQWSLYLIRESLTEPLKITFTVLIAGLLFRLLQKSLDRSLNLLVKRLGVKFFIFLLVTGLGVLSSIITAIIASLILVEIISFLKLDKKTEIKIVILTCFSIGFGAVLTPVGEPLSTITTAKLKGPPYNANFWFLLRALWLYILPAVILLGLFSTRIVGKNLESNYGLREKKQENFMDILVRTLKIYLFVAGLILLGTGFKPLIDTYVSKIPFYFLYWINISSAALDNATLAAAEIGPSLDLAQIKSAIIALVIAGGMLIPGNIPNIIAANKLGIKSKEWARIGVPLGLALLVIYFFIIIAV